MKRSIFFLPVLLIAIAIISSCDNNDLGKLRQAELEKLDAYIQENYPNVDPKPSGLYYVEVDPGIGDTIKYGDQVQIFYKIMTLDSVLVDETNGYSLGQRYDPISMTVVPPTQLTSSATSINKLIGLNEALTYMRKDGKAKLVIPSELAFGQNGTYGVAGFTSLLMQVEVYKVYPVNTGQ